MYIALCTLGAQTYVHSNGYNYQDGFYASYEEFISNSPSIPFNEFDIKWGDSKYFNQLKITKFKRRNVSKKKERIIDTRKIWGVCVNGVPYIHYGFFRNSRIFFGNSAGSKDHKANFTRIRIIGNICHFNVEDYFSTKNTIGSFRDMTGPSSSKMVRKQMIMKLSTGQVADFNEHTFKAFIKDDSKLYSHFLKNEKKETKIFLYLQKYNKRNPMILASNED